MQYNIVKGVAGQGVEIMEWLSKSSSFLEFHSTTIELVLIVLAVISALLSLLFRISGSQLRQWPPGPPAWPIIGHLHLLGKLPHQSLCKLSSTYGPLMGLRLGGVRAIIVSSPQMAKEVLQTHDLVFANRPRFAAPVHMFFDCRTSAFAPYGDPFRKLMRQMFTTELFNAKRRASFRHVQEEEARGLARALAEMGKQGKQAVELRPSILAASNNITCRMVMGKKLAELSTSMSCERGKEELMSLVDELMHLLAVFYIGDFVPWLWWLDPHGYLKRMKATGQKAKTLMQGALDKRRQEMMMREGSRRSKDLLDVLLAAAADPNNNVPITDDNIMGVMLDLFGASETSAVIVEWTLAELIRNERVMHRLQEEIDSMVGHERLVAESDIENLPYLALAVKEGFRLHPVAPFLIPRESSRECQIAGYTIPAKTRAYVNVWAIGRDPLLWEQPLQFWPERFENNNLDLSGKTFELLPFGVGRRGCPGLEIGLLNVHLMLATLVQGFNWSFGYSSHKQHDPHTKSFDMTERFGLSLTMDKSLCVFPTPRLPLHMY